jgi:hypothetical protein
MIEEVVPVLCATVMELLDPGEKIVIRKSEVAGSPANERWCVQIDSTSLLDGEEVYRIRVIPFTEQMRRQAMGVTEEDLRSQLPADAAVVVNHYRNVNEDDFVQLPKYRALDAGYTLATRGGFTIVTIESPPGHEVATGLAVCAPTDNYCRAEGRVLALERAVKAWHVGLHISREQVLHGTLGVDLLSDPRPWPGEGPRLA